MFRLFFGIIILLLFISCSEENLPKPKAFLKLEYGEKVYRELTVSRPYSFEVSNKIILKDMPKKWLKIEYPSLKATVDITYRKVENNLRELLIESEKLVFKHTSKAEKITSNDYLSDQKKVYATLHNITGNAASQLQFHITDSINHFIKGALYFKIKPNYDSVLPAVAYIKKDILHLIETFNWEE
ncbi:gliding motility lipoprotein GldD [Flavobacteriaceae bacterium]|nr:gliding motility lipoprotein GldD [Flavobacteriaceae bacterium]MDB2684753.1 gliding motility lipoprotein GldD [Flavobacteriaceae bacterium]